MSNFQIEDQLALNGGGCGMSMYLDPPKRSLESKPSPTGSQKEEEPQNGESASSSTMSRTSSRSTMSIKTAKSAINDDPGMSDLFDSFSDVFTTITVSVAPEIVTITKNRKEKGFMINIKQKRSTQNSQFDVCLVCFLDRIYTRFKFFYSVTSHAQIQRLKTNLPSSVETNFETNFSNSWIDLGKNVIAAVMN